MSQGLLAPGHRNVCISREFSSTLCPSYAHNRPRVVFILYNGDATKIRRMWIVVISTFMQFLLQRRHGGKYAGHITTPSAEHEHPPEADPRGIMQFSATF